MAEDVLADTQRAEAAAVGERRKRLDLVSFIPRILHAEPPYREDDQAYRGRSHIGFAPLTTTCQMFSNRLHLLPN
jgi:hypothetical protein